uniref:Major facilitator superfamily (MFS) profile domain-containing protein n=2 Tax=Graphocephala atropunctata TaxID=36148 RepID=A0A1B6MA13_9HEMI
MDVRAEKVSAGLQEEEEEGVEVLLPLQNVRYDPGSKSKAGKMEEPEEKCSSDANLTHSRLNLYLSIFVVNLLYMCTGQCYVWTSPTLPYLLSKESFLPTTPAQGSVIASVFVFGGVLGALLTRPLADSLGRRWTLGLCQLSVLASWALLGLTADVNIIYIARLVQGLSTGINFSVGPLYTAEISDDTVRGALNSIPLFSRSCGYVFVYSFGPYVTYHQLIVIAAIGPVVGLLLTPLIAESPHYQVARGKRTKAIKTVQWLRGGMSYPAAEKEVDAIQEYYNQTATQKKSIKDLVATIGNIRALYLSAGLLGVQQLCGVTVILLYTEPIFQMTGTSISASMSAIMFGVTLMVSAIIVPPFVKRFGFIKPMILSSLGCAIFVGLLGVFFFLQSLKVDISTLNWLPVTSTVLYTVSYSIGIGTLPWAVMGEIFPANTKSLAAGILTSFNFLLGFLTAVLFVEVNEWLGVCWSFWMYAVFSLLAAPFTKYLLPDTQGLSLDQIQRLVNQPWNTKWSRKPDLVI